MVYYACEIQLCPWHKIMLVSFIVNYDGLLWIESGPFTTPRQTIAYNYLLENPWFSLHIICWQLYNLSMSRNLSAMMLYGNKLTVGVSL